jgi:hypothetical protein
MSNESKSSDSNGPIPAIADEHTPDPMTAVREPPPPPPSSNRRNWRAKRDQRIAEKINDR